MTINIGADVVYVWDDEPGTELHGYISFGSWEDDADFDSFGVPDLDVFFYSSEEELPKLMAAGNGSDFQVKSFEYRMVTVVEDE
jgi:hypothetical protein